MLRIYINICIKWYFGYFIQYVQKGYLFFFQCDHGRSRDIDTVLIHIKSNLHAAKKWDTYKHVR